MSRNFQRPLEIQSALKRYKALDARITRWLIQAANARNIPIAGSPDPEYVLLFKEYLTLSRELVSQGVRPPSTLKTLLNATIRLRQRCWQWFSRISPRQFIRNNGHLGFIQHLRRVRKIWFNTPLEYDTPDSDQEEPPFLGVIGFAGCRNSPDSDDEDISTEDGESSGHSLNDTTDTDAGYRNSPDSDDEDISTEDNESSSDSPHDTTDIEDEIAVDTDTGEGESCGESDQETDTDSSEMDSEDSESSEHSPHDATDTADEITVDIYAGEDESRGESDTDDSDTDSEDSESSVYLPHDTTDTDDEIAVDTDTGEDESSGESDQETDTDSSDTDSEDLEEEKEALGRPFHKYNFMR